jgi:MATE family multidrug resistance protein
MPPRHIRSASPFESSFTSSSPLVEASIARDLAEYGDEELSDGPDGVTEARPSSSQAGTNPYSLAGSYRRPGYFTTVNHGTMVPASGDQQPLSQREREQAIEEERHLLSDNHVIPEPHGLQHKISGLFSRIQASAQQGPSKTPSSEPSEPDYETALTTETTALLRPATSNDQLNLNEIDRKWEEAVAAGMIHTTWQREAQVIGKYSLPLMVTFLLQYSLTVASIFTLGHIGKEELGAVSLASMTVSITGNAVYSGLATSLDTLCAQAYGSGKKKLVGLQCCE